jgi:DNA helicase II / ATP-dependent DNA helicase PcrA
MGRVDILSGLNPQQKEAVTADGGPVLVLAGPGSGKTRVLTHRIAYLINNLGVRPYNILAMTFTNKAAREMGHRIENLLDARIEGLWLGTYHAECARILRRESETLPFNSSFVIFDADDQLALVKRALKELNIDEKQFRPQGVHSAISSAKNSLILPSEFQSKNYKDEVVGRVYKHYQELLLTCNAVDFDDLLLWTWRLLVENPDLREKYARRFEHILVDEFQDTNTAQYELLRQLAWGNENIFVVGDEDQSIYRWRGADFRNVLRFEEDYPKARKILLEKNYRSTQTVLDAAVAVIDRNLYRTPKRLHTDRGMGEKLVLYEAADDKAEAAFVVDKIQELTSRSRSSMGDFAVMYRTNAHSRLVEEAFLRAGVPYRLVGAQRFYGRREIKDLIAYLRLVQNPADELSLSRAINVPPRGIGEKTLLALNLAAQQADTTPGDVLMSLGRRGKESPFWAAMPRGANQLADFGAHLAGWREHLDTMPLPELFNRILEDTLYYEYINDGSEEGEGRWENIQELFRLTHEYEDKGLPSFLENMALVSDQDTVPEEVDAPTLLTLHAAKGLEFPVVFIVGLDDGVLPHSRSLDDPEEMAEERRLFYVGLTRAKNRVFLVRAEQRSTYGNFQESDPSRFLQDIPEDMLQVEGYRRRNGMRSARSTRWDNSTPLRDEPYTSRNDSAPRKSGSGVRSTPTYTTPPPPGGSAPIIEPAYRAGMRVSHSMWAEGLVIESRVLDGEEILTVVFDSVGLKRLVASLANLEIIKK